MSNYYIIRFYKDGTWVHPRIIKRGLTLEEAQAHCRDPETSSDTCTLASGKELTRKAGPWFDGYDHDQ